MAPDPELLEDKEQTCQSGDIYDNPVIANLIMAAFYEGDKSAFAGYIDDYAAAQTTGNVLLRSAARLEDDATIKPVLLRTTWEFAENFRLFGDSNKSPVAHILRKPLLRTKLKDLRESLLNRAKYMDGPDVGELLGLNAFWLIAAGNSSGYSEKLRESLTLIGLSLLVKKADAHLKQDTALDWIMDPNNNEGWKDSTPWLNMIGKVNRLLYAATAADPRLGEAICESLGHMMATSKKDKGPLTPYTPQLHKLAGELLDNLTEARILMGQITGEEETKVELRYSGEGWKDEHEAMVRSRGTLGSDDASEADRKAAQEVVDINEFGAILVKSWIHEAPGGFVRVLYKLDEDEGIKEAEKALPRRGHDDDLGTAGNFALYQTATADPGDTLTGPNDHARVRNALARLSPVIRAELRNLYRWNPARFIEAEALTAKKWTIPYMSRMAPIDPKRFSANEQFQAEKAAQTAGEILDIFRGRTIDAIRAHCNDVFPIPTDAETPDRNREARRRLEAACYHVLRLRDIEIDALRLPEKAAQSGKNFKIIREKVMQKIRTDELIELRTKNHIFPAIHRNDRILDAIEGAGRISLERTQKIIQFCRRSPNILYSDEQHVMVAYLLSKLVRSQDLLVESDSKIVEKNAELIIKFIVREIEKTITTDKPHGDLDADIWHYLQMIAPSWDPADKIRLMNYYVETIGRFEGKEASLITGGMWRQLCALLAFKRSEDPTHPEFDRQTAAVAVQLSLDLLQAYRGEAGASFRHGRYLLDEIDQVIPGDGSKGYQILNPDPSNMPFLIDIFNVVNLLGDANSKAQFTTILKAELNKETMAVAQMALPPTGSVLTYIEAAATVQQSGLTVLRAQLQETADEIESLFREEAGDMEPVNAEKVTKIMEASLAPLRSILGLNINEARKMGILYGMPDAMWDMRRIVEMQSRPGGRFPTYDPISGLVAAYITGKFIGQGSIDVSKMITAVHNAGGFNLANVLAKNRGNMDSALTDFTLDVAKQIGGPLVETNAAAFLEAISKKREALNQLLDCHEAIGRAFKTYWNGIKAGMQTRTVDLTQAELQLTTYLRNLAGTQLKFFKAPTENAAAEVEAPNLELLKLLALRVNKMNYYFLAAQSPLHIQPPTPQDLRDVFALSTGGWTPPTVAVNIWEKRQQARAKTGGRDADISETLKGAAADDSGADI